ncbi:MAG: hypothetical protein ACI9FB_002159 [Candidatus Azotimanducaceae bacterium]|jgi:hypothetical protein
MRCLSSAFITLLLALNSVFAHGSSITEVVPVQTLASGVATANIWAQGITSESSTFNVRASITTPDTSSTITVSLFENNIAGRYEASYTDFTLNGTYTIEFVVEDTDGVISEAVSTSLIQSGVIDINGPDFFEDDDTGARASLLIVNDISTQRHTFHDVGDVDYVQFTARGKAVFEVELNTFVEGEQANLSDPVLSLLSIEFVFDAISIEEVAVETLIFHLATCLS